MRVSRSIVLALGVSAISVMGVRVHAAPIASLNPGGHQSAVTAFASDDDIGSSSTNDVNSLPFTSPTAVTDGENSSTVGSNLTNSALHFTFTQAILDTASPGATSGTGDIFFTAGANTTYAIAGSMTVTDVFQSAELETFLKDVTSDTFVYDYDKTTGPSTGVQPAGVQPDCIVTAPTTTLTLDTTGGPLTGSLNAGDTYEFFAYQEMQVNETSQIDPGSSGNVNLSLAQSVNGGGSSVPLPPSAFGGLIALMGIGLTAYWRKPGVA